MNATQLRTYKQNRAKGYPAKLAYSIATQPANIISGLSYAEDAAELELDGWTVHLKIESDDDVGTADFLGEITHIRDCGQCSDWGDLTGNTKRQGTYRYISGRGGYDHAHISLTNCNDEETLYDANLKLSKMGKAAARQQAHEQSEADRQRFDSYLDNQWGFVGIIATIYDPEGDVVAESSVWGVESDSDDYISEVAREQAQEAVYEANDKLKADGLNLARRMMAGRA